MNADSAPRWPPTLRPSQPTWTASPPERNGSYRPHPPSPFYNYSARELILILPSHGMEGGSLGRLKHCSKRVQPVRKAVCLSGCRDKHNCPRWDSNRGHLTRQSCMLSLGHCDKSVIKVKQGRHLTRGNSVEHIPMPRHTEISTVSLMHS